MIGRQDELRTKRLNRLTPRQPLPYDSYMPKETPGMVEPLNCEVPSPETPEQLAQYIASLAAGKGCGYGAAPSALAMAALAAFNYMSEVHGVSGAQAERGVREFMRRALNIDGPFMVIRLQDALFPQRDIFQAVRGELEENGPWLKARAAEYLARGDAARPDVIAHWNKPAEAPDAMGLK